MRIKRDRIFSVGKIFPVLGHDAGGANRYFFGITLAFIFYTGFYMGQDQRRADGDEMGYVDRIL